ncbi:MAG: hypothetical protein ACHQRL_03110 [Gemmatimonadales bacterium]
MSALSLTAPLLAGVDLSPGQLAELRAIDVMYHTRRAASDAAGNNLEYLVVARVREMLRDDQKPVFDRNWASRRRDWAHGGDRVDPDE